MATLGQVEAVVRFIQNYMNDSKKSTKAAFYCSSRSNSFSLLKIRLVLKKLEKMRFV